MQDAIASCAALVATFALAAAPVERAPAPQPKPAAQADMAEIVGYYACAGSDGKNKYSGVVSIERQADVYLVRWTIGLGGYMGIGIRQGNDLSVGWQMEKTRGVTHFRIGAGKTGPTLTGRWLSAPGDGQPHEETLRWLKGPDPEIAGEARVMPRIDDDD